MSVSSLAAAPMSAPAHALPAAATATPSPANDSASANDATPAVQISLSAEASLSITVTQETRITIQSVSAGQDGKAPNDSNTAHALSTLECVAAAQRAWLKALEAKRDGHPTPKADDAQSDKTGAATTDAAKTGDANQAGGLQISIEQDTEIDVELDAGAQLDISA